MMRPSSSLGLTADDYARDRDEYRPDRIRVLWIAESPPASGSYFYFPQTTGKDNLFRETMRALHLWPLRVPMKKGIEKKGLLEQFQRRGFFLVDTCPVPIDKLSDPDRRAAVLEGGPRVARFARQLKPDGIIIVKSNVYCPVKQALDSIGYGNKVLNKTALPFPSHGGQSTYRKRVAKLVGSVQTTIPV